ncbi:MAG: PIN domain-containing protein [Aeromicrobium sp.]|nr:PIN domain-containing protein [Burkholderiales bacterium]
MPGIARYVAVLDACVLYPAPIRDLLLSLADADLYHAKWTQEIQDEWVNNLLVNRPSLKRESLEKTCADMAAAVPDCWVTNYEFIIPMLTLPDDGDRHVLAAAIKCNADAIVTSNLKDFPPTALDPYGIEAQHPDDFVMNQIELGQPVALEAIKKLRQRLRNPPKTVGELIATIEHQLMPQTAAFMRQWQGLI